jgi:uncharacterized protein
MVSLLSLVDDIASTLDDISVMTKVAIKKTATLMSDDLAVNSAVVGGVAAQRELPVVWKIFVGSLFNKVYCIVGALAILSVYPKLLDLILIVGGLYLAYEGAYKVYEKIFHRANRNAQKKVTEAERIKGAVRTDFILSIEIIVIANSTISGPFVQQIAALATVGFAVSVIIYGLVALIVKIDDAGLFLVKKGYNKVGMALVRSMPYTMKGLGIIGTIAMFLVGGGIVAHAAHLNYIEVDWLQNLIVGVIVGGAVLGVIGLSQLLFKRIIK